MKIDAAALTEKLEAMRLEQNYAGIAVTIRGPEGIIYEQGFGKRSIARDLPVDGDTMFGVASMSKSMTALACCMLHAEGKMSIYDPVAKYFPAFRVPGIPAELLTVDMLMQHRACIPPMEPLEWSIAMNSVERDSEWYRTMRATSPNKMDKIEQIVDYISAGDYVPLGMPGEYSSYSNEGYAILSYIVDQAAGIPLEQFLKERIFEPLGMTRSILDEDCSEAQAMAGGNITSLFEQGENGELLEDDNWSILPPFRGCACVKSTSRDMSAYYLCLQNHGMHEGRQVIDPAAVELMYGARFPLEEEPYYCCGLKKQNIKGETVVFHAGGLHGVSTFGALLSGGYSLAVLTNTGDMDPEDLAWVCYNAVYGWPLEETHNWAEPNGKDFSMPELLCGTYLVKEGMPVKSIVTCENGRLKALHGDKKTDLLWCGGSVFAAVREEDHSRRVSTMKFFLREGKTWAVRCGTRFYQRVEE